MRPIQYPITPAQQLDNISRIPIREFRGLNTFDPLAIGDNYWSDVSNLDSSSFPAVEVRPGYSVIGQHGTKVLGLGAWKGSEIHAVFNDGTWRKWDGSAWTTLKSGLSTTAEWSFTNFEGAWDGINLVGANGVNGLHRYDGSTVQTFGDAPANINHLTTYQNRIWGAFGNEIRACRLDNGEQWNHFPLTEEDSYGKTIESDRGEAISFLSGSMSKLVIGFPNSVRELYGALPSDFADKLVTDDEGFVNNHSGITNNGTLSFLHRTGIYQYSGGSLPSSEWSEIIGGYPLNLTSVATGTDGHKLYFQADTDLIVFDGRTDIYAWNIWHGINATCFLFTDGLYVGDAQGRVLKLGGSTDNGSPIAWHAVSKAFSAALLAQLTRWYKLYITAELAVGSTFNVSMSKSVDGNDWELVQSVVGNGLGTTKILVPVGKYALESYVRIKLHGTGYVKLYEITRQTRTLPLGG
jgi:hypothetical protein